MLEAACGVVDVNPHDRAMTRGEFLEAVEWPRQGVLCLLTEDIDDEVLDISPGLTGIAMYAVGYNNVDVDACTRRGIPVTNTPGVLTDTTADIAWALIFATARRGRGRRPVRAGGTLCGMGSPADAGQRRHRQDAGHHWRGAHRHGHGPAGRRVFHAGGLYES